MIIAETYTQLITDPAHILFELTLELVTGLAVYPLGRYLLRRVVRKHDKEVHGG